MKRVLEDKAYGHVITFSPSGQPQVTMVWLDVEGGEVLFNTAEGRKKPQNLRRDSRVIISAQNRNDLQSYVVLHGAATVTEAGADPHIDKLAKRFLGLDKYPFRRGGMAAPMSLVSRVWLAFALKRRNPVTGATYPWLYRTTVMVNHYYFYLVDADFGPLFIKFASYFPYSLPPFPFERHLVLAAFLAISARLSGDNRSVCALPPLVSRVAPVRPHEGPCDLAEIRVGRAIPAALSPQRCMSMSATDFPIGQKILLHGHFRDPVVLEAVRPIDEGYERRVRHPDARALGIPWFLGTPRLI